MRNRYISRIEAESTKSDIFGKSGSIRLTANSEILIDGKSDDGKKISSGISTSLQDGSKANGGDIIISAKNLRILNGGSLNNMSGKDSSGIGGDINLDITNILELSASRNGKESEIGSNAGGIGKSGNNITIHTNQLIHKDGAQLYTDNLDGSNVNGIGKLGNITITATDSVEVSGVSRTEKLFGFAKPTGITSPTGSKKNAGDILIQTPRFLLRDGASISNGTDSSGLGGSILITGLNGKNAELVELSGNSGIDAALGINTSEKFSGIGNGSRIRSITSTDSQAGRVTVKADRISLKSGTRIDVSTLNGNNDGGSIDIYTQALDLSDGGQLISTTRGSGQAGSINVNADQVLLSGTDKVFNEKRAFFDFINTINSQSNAREEIKNYLKSPNSEGRMTLLDVIYSTKSSRFSDVDRNSFRIIIADYFKILEEDAKTKDTPKINALRAFTRLETAKGATTLDFNIYSNSSKNSGVVSRVITGASGNGGDINISVNQSLSLRNQSQILATADVGYGGNITIQSPNGSVVAVPTENSDISASAANGRGGKVIINALNVVGFSTRASDRFSDITADGGTPGVVTINSNDPNRGLQPKLIEPGAPNITQECRTINNTQISKLASSGKGGITPNPNELIPSNNIWTESTKTSNPNQPTLTISAAKGWVAGQGRTVILTSQPHNDQPITNNSNNPNCYAK